MRTLGSAVMREAAGWFTVYASAYLALIGLAIGAPLVRKGAPLDAVAMFLVDQFVFLGVIILPLAMVTAMLGVIGRMREEGEITAVMAGGISTWGVARSLLPLAAALALLVAYASHWLMPGAMRRIFEGQSQLYQQGIATQVARRVPIVSSQGTVVAAIAAEKQRLLHVFAVTETKDESGNTVRRTCYAPEARWMWIEDEAQLGFDLREPVVVQTETPRPGQPREIVSAFIENYWSIRESDWETLGGGGKGKEFALFQTRGDIDMKADVLSTPELVSRIANWEELAAKGRSQKYLRSLQRVLHLRLTMPAAVLAYWAFACGLGLAMGRGNRLFSMCLGILVVVTTIIGPVILVKNLRGSLQFDPGFILWPPILGVGAFGAWLLWRWR